MSVSAVVATIHLRIHQGGTSIMEQPQEQGNTDALIYGLNETMIGKFDALSARIDRLESTLTDDALALSSEQEALIAGIRERLDKDGESLAKWFFSSPNNWVLLEIFSIVSDIATQNGLDPNAITDRMTRYFREQLETE